MKELLAELTAVLAEGSAFSRMRYNGQSYLVPVEVEPDAAMDDLLGIEAHKNAVQTNIARFLAGKPYNHMLLWGARGTGKSSLIRAVFADNAAQGLVLLQLACDDLQDLGFLLWAISRVPRKFMIYIDDLSFSDNDSSYRVLKAVLDGSIAGMPKNALLCVTSNRRHLLTERCRSDDAIHPEEDIEEQISLAERFGLRLSFHPLSQQQYLEAAAHWAARRGIVFTDDARRAALQFSLARGSRSARVAEQFVRQLGE